jgi:hypothetical protein
MQLDPVNNMTGLNNWDNDVALGWNIGTNKPLV